MSLHNKNNQFLGSQGSTTDDVVDIFDQYGVGDTPSGASVQVSDDVQDDDSFAQNDHADIVDENEEISMSNIAVKMENAVAQNDVFDVPPVVHKEEKKWEETYEGGQETVAAVVPETDASHDLDKKNNSDAKREVMSSGSEIKTENIVVTPTQTQEEKVSKDSSVEISTQQKVVQATDPEPAVVQMQPVAAPVKENINAVVQNDHRKESRQSFVQSAAPKTSQRRKVTIDPGKKTIAIVDDDVDTLDMYANIFEMADYNVIRASDGLEALSVISDHTPHLIFTGIVMPRMDGFAMIEALKQNKRTSEIPVVINSHLGREADRKRAEELGAKDFIIRGFTPPREVLERIGALLLRSEYTFRFDATDPEARKLVKDLGASNFFVCPRGQEMVIKLSIEDPKELMFSARFSCVDEKNKEK